ncbi:MAG: Flp pilus assembly complex ATPase component TadA [Candidatus Aenigmarchaeota archaeon]|nr:Flp pilus assembly complex ATPase component TadA [Candidatus Aenigmarchaeota archaeon]
MVFEHELIDGILRINCLNSVYGSTVEDSDVVMSVVIDKILEVKKVERIILAETREYEYDFEQTRMLVEIANAFNKLVNEDRILSVSRIVAPGCDKYASTWFNQVQMIVLEMIRRDPIGAYVKVKRMIRDLKYRAEKLGDLQARRCYEHFIQNCLVPIKETLEATKLIQLVKDKLEGHKIGDRQLYREIFNPLIRPNFMLTRFMSTPPKEGRPIAKYTLPDGKTTVEIFKIPGKVRPLYFIVPPEFRLSEEKYMILDTARRYMAEHKPTRTEFTQPEKAREIFLNIGRDLIRELAASMNVKLTAQEIEELAQILARYTAGFGILEVILSDEKIQDVYINSPVGLTPMYVKHADFDECETNLIPTREDAESWATRFRMFSGRPLDEANPVLDTELIVPGGRARVCAITRTLSPEGLGFAFRRHRDRPWTYPLFINVKYMNPLFAGLMSFIIDGSRSFLIAGTRGSGKTSFLGASMLEIMKKFRIITVEDSVTGDCKVSVEKDGKRIEITIEELFNLLSKKSSIKRIGEREVIRLENINLKVLSIDRETLLPIYKSPSFIVRHFVKKPIFSIKTESGFKIKVTGDHSLFRVKDNSMEGVKASLLKIGDVIAVVKNGKVANEKILKIEVDENKNGVLVYDISVPKNENFVCENIIAHNTLELPVVQLRDLGYNIERLKSRSVITRVESELPADEALRTALRLGDSCLIIGEVRSLEAKALFEAMRIGALANVVAGTIHGDSPYGVFDRVVNDLGVPPTSFKAIDVIVIANVLRSPDGLTNYRRIVEITEVRKHWKEDPMAEDGFVTLMRYDAKEDTLKPTDTLLNGESYVLNEIMKRVREWRDNWEAVWDNILLRAKIKETMVDYAKKLNNFEILEAPMVVTSNEMFHMISEKVREEVGQLDSKMIYEKWLEWFKAKLKGKE